MEHCAQRLLEVCEHDILAGDKYFLLKWWICLVCMVHRVVLEWAVLEEELPACTTADC